MQIDYALTTDVQQFGSLSLLLTRLRSLDETIDALFGRFAGEQSVDHARWLEDLCPYFGVIWPSARVLTEEWITRFAGATHPPTVLELGCGLAIPSLAAAQLGSRVVATDFHPDVPEFLHMNREQNRKPHAALELHYLRMNWLAPPPPALGEHARASQGWDWIIGSDILYEKAHPEAVADTFQKLRALGRSPAGKSPRILLADPGRPYLEAFSQEMKKKGFSEQIHVRRTPHETAPQTLREIFLLEYS